MNQNMSKREMLVVDYLKDKQRLVTSQELSAYLSVSKRTIKRDFNHINSVIENKTIKSIPGKGYIIEKFVRSSFQDISRD